MKSQIARIPPASFVTALAIATKTTPVRAWGDAAHRTLAAAAGHLGRHN